MVRRTRMFALPLGVAVLSLTMACSSSENPTEPGPTVADVDEYLWTLPSWDEFAEPVPDAEVIGAEPAYYEQTGPLFCSVTEASITRNPEDIVTYSPDSEILWLGSLIQGRHHRDGLGSLLEVPVRQRGPLTVSIDLLFVDNTRVVERPTLATVSQAIGELIDRADAAGHKSGSSIFFNQVENHSFEQSVLKLGLSAKYMSHSVKASLDTDRTEASNSLTATFVQKMFTTSMVLPQAPRDVFGPDFTAELLQEQVDRGYIGSGNLPVYVGSITWGRMLTVTMTSDSSVADMKAALDASSSFGGFDLTVDADYKHHEVLSNSEIKVVAIGGHAQAAIDLIRTGELGSYFETTAALTTARPISYVLRNLSDNSIAKVSETTEYAIRECSEGGVKRYNDFTEWEAALTNTDVVGVNNELTAYPFLTTSANVGLASELNANPGGNAPVGPRLTFQGSATGLPFSFYLDATNAYRFTDAANQSWMLVFRDQEFYGGLDRWISIGDVDGRAGNNRDLFENDDFDIRILPDTSGVSATVYAVGTWVGDNSKESGESITVRGDGFEVRFDEGWNDFVGFIAPFPITNVHFDESSAGGDDIGIRDFHFGAR